MTLLLGSHVERADPLGGARTRGAQAIQVNLSAPQAWKDPVVKGDEELLAAAARDGLPIFVHAPYLVNVASVRPEIRARSVTALAAQRRAAARIGATGLVVHGGHPTGDGTLADGIAGWLEALDRLDELDALDQMDSDSPACRILIENTAGGRCAVARHLDAITALFDAVRGAGHDVGFVLDTCHAHAGGLDPERLIDRIMAATGEITLVHVNDSKDPFGSGRDRHETLGMGTVDDDWLVAVVGATTAVGVPAVVETPGGADGQRRDLEWLVDRLG